MIYTSQVIYVLSVLVWISHPVRYIVDMDIFLDHLNPIIRCPVMVQKIFLHFIANTTIFWDQKLFNKCLQHSLIFINPTDDSHGSYRGAS